jgi:hypothetical protein
MYESRTRRSIESVLTKGGKKIKEKNGGPLSLRYIVRTFVNATMYPQYNYNMLKNQ